MPEPKRPLKVFLCYAHADKPKVRELYRYLKRRGINPWFDEEHLVGGQDWQVEIPKALATSDAIIICMTKNSVDKEGYIQKEIKFALDKALEMPEGRIFLIPVKFEECEVPFTLSRYQWVDLTVESGYAKMMKSLKFRASQLERSTVEVSKKDIEENLAREKKEREIAEKDAREKAEKDVAEKARLKAEEEERQRIAKEKAESEAIEKAAREKAEKEATEKARLLTEEKERQRIAKQKADREQKNEEVRLKKEQETSEKAKHSGSGASVEKVNQGKKGIRTESSKPNLGNQIIYWIGGFGLIVFGIILLSSLNNPPAISQATPENTQTQAIAAITQGTVDPGATATLNAQSPTILVEDSPFELVFVSKEGDYMNLYQLRTNGEKRNLTKDAKFSLIANPTLSPDGQFIAFETDEGSFIVDVGSSSLTLISSYGHRPSWNPITRKIAYVSDDTIIKDDLCSLIWEVYAHGGLPAETYLNCYYTKSGQETILSNQQIYLIDMTDSEMAGGDDPLIAFRGVDFPAWNYTGEKLAYVKRQNVDFICIDEVSDLAAIIQIGCQQIKDFIESYDYSPAANEIVYSAEWKGSSNIYLLNTDDFSQTELTTGTNNNYSPIWGHSGKQIAFVSDRDGNNEIYVMDIANSEIKNLTLSTSNDFSPIWSPDDGKIVFVSDRNDNLDVYSVDINTLETENLTNTSDDEYFPIFIPSTLPLQEPTSTPSVLIDSSPTANPVTAVLNANPRKGEYPLTVNFSANLKLNDNTLICNQNPECSYTWLGLLNLPENVQSFTRTFDGPFTPTVTVIVCYQGMCDDASIVIEVTQR